MIGDQQTLQSIVSTVALEDNNRGVYRKLAFMFGDAALDSDQQLAALGDQWVFKLGEDKYYLPTSKRHLTILFFQLVTKERRIDWIVTRNAESVHIAF